MSGRGAPLKRHAAYDQAAQVSGEASLYLLKTRILVHGRRSSAAGPRGCPCCRSREAEIIRTIDDLAIIVDRVSGKRSTRTERNAAEWDRLADRSHEIVINLRCHDDQLPLLLDDTHKVILSLGGNRAGKTAIAVAWLARQWMKRGGFGALFWMVAPMLEQTRTLVDKLLLGEATETFSPPVLPLGDDGRPLLAASWPETAYAADQSIYMIDGSRIQLRHAGRKGGNLKGRAVQAAIVDEACEIVSPQNWTILLMRTADTKGQIFASTTPIAGHWIKDYVVDKAVTDKNPHGNPDFHVRQLSSAHNPWVDPKEIARIAEDLDDPLMIRREIHGEWVGNKGNLWVHFDPAAHTVDGPGFEAKDYGYIDVTAQAYRGRWRGGNDFVRSFHLMAPRYVAGQDFNTWPMTTVIAQVVAGAAADRQDPTKWIILILDEVQTRETNSYKHSEWLNSTKIRGGRVNYQGLAIACDSTGAYTNVAKVPNDKHSASDAKIMAKFGHDCRPCDYHEKSGAPRNPRKRDSISLVHKLCRDNRLIVHSRCTELLRALNEQEDDGTGIPIKVPSSASDRLSSPIDALRYLSWRLFSREERPVAIAQ